jgi:hypothetical protein
MQTIVGVIIKPLSTLRNIQNDERALQKGWLALMVVLLTYTLILVVFIIREYPAVAPSILPIGVDELYRYQVWYQGPLFIVATLALAGILMLFVRAKGQSGSFPALFARVSFATTVPFALTTMAVELVIAILVLAKILQPKVVLDWLTGNGALFANVYQLVGVMWVILLLIFTAKISAGVTWWLGIFLGVVLACIYGIPVGLFIR